MNSLANSPINIAALRERAKSDLLRCLDTIEGKKALVLDPKLSGPLGLISEYSVLRDHGVEKLHVLQPGKLETDLNVIYICRPKMIYMKYIADHILSQSKQSSKKQWSVFFVPRKTTICERVLEEAGVHGDIIFGEYPLDLITFDEDLISLELDYSFRELYLEGDKTSLYYVARSLMKIQTMYGIIPKIYGKGSCARAVADMITRMRREIGLDESLVTPEIESLVLIDRNLDMITPMCTQLTYEGLIDENFGIANTCVELDAAVTGYKEKRKVPFSSSDSLFRELRDCNFSTVGPILNRSAKRITQEYEERHAAKTVSQIKEFVGKLGTIQAEHQALRIHTNVAEIIMKSTKDTDFNRRLEVEQNLLSGLESDTNTNFIMELIYRQEPLPKVLRLLCLLSMVSNGLKPKVLENIRREILQTYGYDQMFTLINLEKLGLFKKTEGKNPYPNLKKGLKLVVDDVNEKEPDDIAYVYSGYAPLSIRIIQSLLGISSPKAQIHPWRNSEDVSKVIPGPTFEESQSLPSGLQAKKNYGNQSRITLVYFLGGCTFTEISALRYLGQQEGREFIIATTKIMNGSTLLDTVVDKMSNQME